MKTSHRQVLAKKRLESAMHLFFFCFFHCWFHRWILDGESSEPSPLLGFTRHHLYSPSQLRSTAPSEASIQSLMLFFLKIMYFFHSFKGDARGISDPSSTLCREPKAAVHSNRKPGQTLEIWQWYRSKHVNKQDT